MNSFNFTNSYIAGHYEGETKSDVRYQKNNENVKPQLREEWVPLQTHQPKSINDFMIERQMRLILTHTRDDYLIWNINQAAQLYNQLRDLLSDPSSMPVATSSRPVPDNSLKRADLVDFASVVGSDSQSERKRLLGESFSNNDQSN